MKKQSKVDGKSCQNMKFTFHYPRSPAWIPSYIWVLHFLLKFLNKPKLNCFKKMSNLFIFNTYTNIKIHKKPSLRLVVLMKSVSSVKFVLENHSVWN